MDAPSPSPPITITNREELEAWLQDKPRDLCVTIASRAALRVWPYFRSFKVKKQNYLEKDMVLSMFRGVLSSNLISNSNAAAINVNATFAEVGAYLEMYAYKTAFAVAYAADAGVLNYAESSIGNALSAIDAAASIDSIDTWQSVSGDVTAFDAGKSVEAVRVLPLWRSQTWENPIPSLVSKLWKHFKSQLIAYNNGWEIWIEWYERRLRGAPFSAQDLAKDKAFARALEDLDLWQEPDEEGNIGNGKNREASDVNTRIQALIDEELAKLAPIEVEVGDNSAVTLDDLARVASPAPILTADGKLDAVPNAVFDKPVVDDDLITLPMRQRNVIDIILEGLPQNAPRHMRRAFENYDHELKVRGAQPILGLIKDAAEIIIADALAPNAQLEWLDGGLRKSFEKFEVNHQLIMQHFPLDVEREEIYSRVDIDVDQISQTDYEEPFKKAEEAITEARDEGLATQNAVDVIHAMTEFAKVITTAPSPPQDTARTLPVIDASAPVVLPSDRLPQPAPVRMKKRLLLQLAGFVSGASILLNIASVDYPQLRQNLEYILDLLKAMGLF